MLRWIISVLAGLAVGGLFKWNNVESTLDVFGWHTTMPVWPSAIVVGLFAFFMVFVFVWAMFSRTQPCAKA